MVKIREILKVRNTSTENRTKLAVFSLDPLLCSTVNDMLRKESLDVIGY